MEDPKFDIDTNLDRFNRLTEDEETTTQQTTNPAAETSDKPNKLNRQNKPAASEEPAPKGKTKIKTVPFAFQLAEEDAENLKVLAKIKGVSMRELLAKPIADFLAPYKKQIAEYKKFIKKMNLD